MDAPRLTVRAVDLFERTVAFRAPFRFGAVTVTGTAQAFVRVEVDVEGHGRAVGATAELMVPKWFDKRPHLTTTDTVDELRVSLAIARDLYAGAGPDTAFGLHAACYGVQRASCAAAGLPALAALFGPAEMDKAICDALLRALRLDWFTGLRANVFGLDARLTPDLTDDAITAYLARRPAPGFVAVRHTVGMADPIEGAEGLAALGRSGVRAFKIKLSGDLEADLDRLARIGAALAPVPDWRASLDANEQYADAGRLVALATGLARTPELAGIAARLLYLEQPLDRAETFARPLGAVADALDVIIDEADDDYGAFPAARALGYRGVSSKSCKGFYKALLNGARAERFSREDGRPAFVTGEDLTCQAGLAVQQDTALAAALGLAHVERNGHHYVAGFGAAPSGEAEAFAAAHPRVYRRTPDGIRLGAEADGRIDVRDLAVPGFASAVLPDFAALAPLAAPARTAFHPTKQTEAAESLS